MIKDNNQRLDCRDFYDHLVSCGVDYFCGVPDSLVSSFSFFLADNASDRHILTANEGNAIGVAIGYNVATNKVPLVYMQNSGLSNAIDPLVSLADPTVFGVPMILLISWRGQPGIMDEPQHTKQGAVTTELLEAMSIPYQILSSDSDIAKQQVQKSAQEALDTSHPTALLLERDTFSDYSSIVDDSNKYPLRREEAIEIIMASLDDSDILVAGIGKISREVFERRNINGEQHDKDLLVVGGMGHASSIALGIAKQKPNVSVFCLDGDGAVLMHMGSLSIIGTQGPANFRHIVLNNGLHDSVGGQHTVGLEVNLPAIAENCGYSKIFSVSKPSALTQALKQIHGLIGPVLLEIRVQKGARANLGRPSIHPGENKKSFTKSVDKK